jgi:putative nucleotidyltransferase with HDIG domain
VIGQSLWWMSHNPPRLEWFILAALTLLTGSFTVKVPSLTARISVSETFVFTSTLLFGPAAGTITVVLDALIISFWLKSSPQSASQLLFNLSAPAIAIYSASYTFFMMAGVSPGEIGSSQLGSLIGPLFAFALLYFLVNTWLVAGAIACEKRGSAATIWYGNFPAVSINYFVGGSIAMLIVAYTPNIDLTVLSIIIPLLLISYLTFRTSMGRLEDATKHVSQLNDLYLSTIETLAMAVDAKDQITHGHIRRVQVYATELAKRLGVTDDRQLKAIEAAALLHDMGKLAIPEHILNKPGRLTDTEFEKMKRHSDIGADLLSSIPFPYPVVPIVRHHHENWNGTGYPNGISGTDIPLGARILSVVDCFDALTSDRPYRPRLTTDAAFDILRERRGTMYDPLVVDSFIQAYVEITPAANAAGQQARTLLPPDLQVREIARSFNEIRHSSAEAAMLLEATRAIGQAHSVDEAMQPMLQAIRQFTPGTLVALYTSPSHSEILKCTSAVGDKQHLIVGLEIRKGERITGWAAANEHAIRNSSAVLDLGYVSEMFTPPLKSTLAVPLVSKSTLLGVLTVYSPIEDGFNQGHLCVIESVAGVLTERLANVPDRSAPVLKFQRSK